MIVFHSFNKLIKVLHLDFLEHLIHPLTVLQNQKDCLRPQIVQSLLSKEVWTCLFIRWIQVARCALSRINIEYLGLTLFTFFIDIQAMFKNPSWMIRISNYHLREVFELDSTSIVKACFNLRLPCQYGLLWIKVIPVLRYYLHRLFLILWCWL